jgi:hypothetical protein
MKISDDMVELACVGGDFADRVGMRRALEAALADVPERAESRLARALDAAELLWGVVANASSGDWSQQSQEWQRAAILARESYHQALRAQEGEAIVALIDELQQRRRDRLPKDRADAFALVEKELRANGIRRIDLNEHVICASRPGEGDVLAERAPMPTLLGAVETLGPKESA